MRIGAFLLAPGFPGRDRAARTGVRHVLLMVEGTGDRARTCENIRRLGAEVLPRLRAVQRA